METRLSCLHTGIFLLGTSTSSNSNIYIPADKTHSNAVSNASVYKEHIDFIRKYLFNKDIVIPVIKDSKKVHTSLSNSTKRTKFVIHVPKYIDTKTKNRSASNKTDYKFLSYLSNKATSSPNVSFYLTHTNTFPKISNNLPIQLRLPKRSAAQGTSRTSIPHNRHGGLLFQVKPAQILLPPPVDANVKNNNFPNLSFGRIEPILDTTKSVSHNKSVSNQSIKQSQISSFIKYPYRVPPLQFLAPPFFGTILNRIHESSAHEPREIKSKQNTVISGTKVFRGNTKYMRNMENPTVIYRFRGASLDVDSTQMHRDIDKPIINTEDELSSGKVISDESIAKAADQYLFNEQNSNISQLRNRQYKLISEAKTDEKHNIRVEEHFTGTPQISNNFSPFSITENNPDDIGSMYGAKYSRQDEIPFVSSYVEKHSNYANSKSGYDRGEYSNWSNSNTANHSGFNYTPNDQLTQSVHESTNLLNSKQPIDINGGGQNDDVDETELGTDATQYEFINGGSHAEEHDSRQTQLLSPEVASAGMEIIGSDRGFDMIRSHGSNISEHDYIPPFHEPYRQSVTTEWPFGHLQLSAGESLEYRKRVLKSSRRNFNVPDGDGQVIPGVAGEDYPTLSKPPVAASFPCSYGQGYYADKSTRCQAFFICIGSGVGEPMLCPNGTLFSQDFLVCDWCIRFSYTLASHVMYVETRAKINMNHIASKKYSETQESCTSLGPKTSKIERGNTVDQDELEFFGKRAKEWWVEKEMLHKINKIRVPFVCKSLCKARPDICNEEIMDLNGLTILDVGCGGGFLSEALSKHGGQVTGLDPSSDLIRVARVHAHQDPSLTTLNYISQTIEQHAEKNPGVYESVIVSEVIEHVTQKELFIKACVETLKPGGSIIITTPNQTWRAKIYWIWIGEHIRRAIPMHTHSYSKFIHIDAMNKLLVKYGCHITSIQGFTFQWWPDVDYVWSSSTSVGYALHAIKGN